MKELIIQALKEAAITLEKQVPKDKYITKYSKSIIDVNPLEIREFMKKNNIPDNAEFAGVNNGYDGFEDFVLCWDVRIPTTEQDKEVFRNKRFTQLAFHSVFEYLTSSGYKRIGFNSGSLCKFDTVYSMYKNNEIDRLVEYYSLSFEKIQL